MSDKALLQAAMNDCNFGSVSMHLENIKRDGFTIINDFLYAEDVTRLLDLVRFHYNQNSTIKYQGVPDRDCEDKIVYALPCKDYEFLIPIFSEKIESILKPNLNDTFYKYMVNEQPNYYLSYYNARSSGKKLDLHIDSYIPSPGSYCWSMQVVIALEPMTVENGCTIVVPGSHKSGEYTDRDSKDLTNLLLNAGDVAIWDSRLWHGTRENKTPSTRWALIATFSSWWVKPAMDYTRSLSQTMYSKLSPKERAMLGFCSVPPKDEYLGINTKKGYNDLMPEVTHYQ